MLNFEMVFRVRRGVLPRGPTVNADLVKIIHSLSVFLINSLSQM